MINLTPAHRACIRHYLRAYDMPSSVVEDQIRIRRLPGTDIWEATCADRRGASSVSAQKAVLDLIKTMEDDDDDEQRIL